jgi:hypothetical protein
MTTPQSLGTWGQAPALDLPLNAGHELSAERQEIIAAVVNLVDSAVSNEVARRGGWEPRFLCREDNAERREVLDRNWYFRRLKHTDSNGPSTV